MELETETKIIDNYNTFFYATMCHVCKRFGDGVYLKKCGGCEMIAYCGRQHQKQHWSQHKSLCKAIQDLLQDFRLEDHGDSEEWDNKKLNLILLISFKMGRPLKMYEKEMFQFPRECAVCHERNDTFRNMNDFISTYGNIQTKSEMSYNILAAKHSQYLTRPLTLFHAMQILNYVPHCKDLVIHVVAANYAEESTLMTWEILLHLIRPVISLIIIMIGPELKCKSNLLRICNNCMLQEKKVSLEFHNVLYENYVCSPLFIKPDLIVGFNAGIHEHIFSGETWTPSIQMLAKQNCPFILTCYMQKELEEEMDRINIILDRRVDCLYSGKNSFASLRPFRVFGPEQVFYQNHYLLVYENFYS